MTKLNPELWADLSPVGVDEWRQRVEAELGDASFERVLHTRTAAGIDLQPLYTLHDEGAADAAGFPGVAPFIRGARLLPRPGRGWITVQEVTDLDQRAAADVEQGAEEIWLRFGDAWRDIDAASLERILADVDFGRISLQLEAGEAATAATACLRAVAERRGVAAGDLRGGLGGDPLATLASRGTLAGSLDDAFDRLAELCRWRARAAPRLTALLISTAPYREAGASAVEELAFAMASSLEVLRRLTVRGLTVDEVAREMRFALTLGRDFFMEVAKLRAARLLWAKIGHAVGVGEAAQGMRLHARTARFTRTVRDPWGNLLRCTAECFAAAVGGADSLANAPFDEIGASKHAASRRLALSMQHVLGEEAYLGRVADPAGGSWYLESLTEALARHAWQLLRDIESRGGMAAALVDGFVGERVERSAAEWRQRVATRRAAIIGVSEFVHLGEVPEERPEPRRAAVAPPPALALLEPSPADLAAATAAAVAGAFVGQIATALARGEPTSASPLAPLRLAEPFEDLRAQADAWQLIHGRRPRVFLVNLGRPSDFRARAGFAVHFFAAGGFEAIDRGGFTEAEAAAAACAEAVAEVAVLCSSDAIYAEMAVAVAVARRLRQDGVRLYLAGAAGDREQEYRSVGVEEFIFFGCDALAILRRLHESLA